MAMKVLPVREMRLEKRLTQDEVAEAMGISRAAYAAIERGETARGVDKALRTMDAMPARWDRPADNSN
jgi:transcriptional regulator with XRE-family HTH domain